MLDFNVQLPKKGETRINAIKQIAVLFNSMVSSGQSFDGESSEKSVHAFIKKQLKREEYPLFLALVYSDDETLPAEFDEYGIVTLESIVDNTTNGRVLELNDLLALETDDTLSALARSCGIRMKANLLSQRLELIKRLYENLQTFETVFPTALGILDYMAQRYSFDFHTESQRWKQLCSKLNPSRMVADSTSLGNPSVSKATHSWDNAAVKFFLEQILGHEEGSSRSVIMIGRIAKIGPQEILRRLKNHDLISAEFFEAHIGFEELSFAETMKKIVIGWEKAFEGKSQDVFDSDNADSDSRVLLDDFMRAYREEDEEEDEEEDDEEAEEDEEEDEEDEEESESETSEDEEDEEDDEEEDEDDDLPVAGTPKVFALDKLIEALEEDVEIESPDGESAYLLAPVGDIRRAIQKAYEDSDSILNDLAKDRYYGIYQRYAALAGFDFDAVYSLSEILSQKYLAWEATLDRTHKNIVATYLFEKLLPSLEVLDYTTDEARSELEEYFGSVDKLSLFYGVESEVNAIARKHGIDSFSLDPVEEAVPASKPVPAGEHARLIDKVVELKIEGRQRALTMSVSELRAMIAEHEAMNAQKVTSENYREVIPTLSRQDVIAELAKRGYSDKSLNKLGAPRLREMFLGAMDRRHK